MDYALAIWTEKRPTDIIVLRSLSTIDHHEPLLAFLCGIGYALAIWTENRPAQKEHVILWPLLAVDHHKPLLAFLRHRSRACHLG